MRAEDTMIKGILADHGYTVEEADSILNNAGRAIYQSARREVVQWINTTFNKAITLDQMRATNTWQSKLKEWGV